MSKAEFRQFGYRELGRRSPHAFHLHESPQKPGTGSSHEPPLGKHTPPHPELPQWKQRNGTCAILASAACDQGPEVLQVAIHIKEYEPADAAEMARMFQASDPAWPDGFDAGVLYPPEVFVQDQAENRYLATYIAWDEGRAVGYINLVDIPGQEKAGYVGLLNSDPGYHGRGVGRDLLRRVIDRCVELGYQRVTLGTWPGNTKAVPLYKKTGFQWGPESSDWDELQNHVPLLLGHPLTKPYFETTDWYACQKRDLSLGLDTERRNGALVFPYEWQGPGGTLRAVFDQKAKKLVELDTPHLVLSLGIPKAEQLRGSEQTARFEITNRREQPLRLALTAKGDGPVNASRYELVEVEAGASRVLELKVGTEDEKAGEGSLQLNLLVDGHSLEMASTIKVVAPLEMSLEPSAPPLRPSSPARMTLNVRNRTEGAVEVQFLCTASDALTVTLAQQSLPLQPGEVAGVPVQIVARTVGAHSLVLSPVIATAGKKETRPPLKADLIAVGSGEAAVSHGGDEVSVHLGELVLAIPKKGTRLSLRDRHTGASITSHWTRVGPPFWPNPLEEQEAEIFVTEQSPAGATIVLRNLLTSPSGIVMQRTVRARADGSVNVGVRLENIGAEPRELGLDLGVRGPDRGRADYFPLSEGVVHGPSGYLSWRWGGPGADPPFSARWIALEADPWTAAVFWPDGVRTRSFPWTRLALEARSIHLPPGETWSLGDVTFMPTQGGWHAVEREWQRREGIEPSDSQVYPAAGARVVPSPVLLAGEQAAVDIEARNVTARSVDGRVSLHVTEGFGVTPRTLEFHDVSCASSPCQTAIVSRDGAERLVAELSLDTSFPGSIGRATTPVIALGSIGGEVRVAQAQDGGEDVWRVENGWLSFGVRPSVLASVYTLSSPDGEHLYSNFPEPAARHWFYPVYGGIRPVLWGEDQLDYTDLGRLSGLTLHGEETERQGSQGILWRGVRL